MAVAFVDFSRADDTGDGLSWENAEKTLAAGLLTAGANGTLYVADTHNETSAAAATLTLPAGIKIFSSDVLTGTNVSYKLPTDAQFKVTNAGADLTITQSGDAAIYGLWLEAADDLLTLGGVAGSTGYYEDCEFEISTGTTGNISTNTGTLYLKNCTIKLNDSGATAVAIMAVAQGAFIIIENLVFAGTLTNRTTHIFTSAAGDFATGLISGLDASGLTGMAAGDYFWSKNTTEMDVLMFNGVNVDTGVVFFGAADSGYRYPINIATAQAGAGWNLYQETYLGSTLAQTSITRDDGSTINSQRVAWTVTSTANCDVANLYFTPWMETNVSTTGNKTFTVYIGNATSDFTDTQVWLEVEYLNASGIAVLASDRLDDRLAAGSAQTDDATDWDTDLTYGQALAVTASVGVVSTVRARVVVAIASRTLYVDPHINVS